MNNEEKTKMKLENWLQKREEKKPDNREKNVHFEKLSLDASIKKDMEWEWIKMN